MAFGTINDVGINFDQVMKITGGESQWHVTYKDSTDLNVNARLREDLQPLVKLDSGHYADPQSVASIAKASNQETYAYYADGSDDRVTSTIGDLAKKLPEFVALETALVNPSHIHSVEKHDGQYSAHLSGGASLPLSGEAQAERIAKSAGLVELGKDHWINANAVKEVMPG